MTKSVRRWVAFLASALLATGCAGLLAGVGAPPAARDPELAPLRTRVVFTDAIDEHQAPVNVRHSVPLAPVPFYVYVHWLDLEPGEHVYALEIFDGAGELVSVQRMTFVNSGLGWKTWSWYQPMPGVDAPGTWRFEFSLDGAFVLSSRLEVRSDVGP